jgi:hypothetical protein
MLFILIGSIEVCGVEVPIMVRTMELAGNITK